MFLLPPQKLFLSPYSNGRRIIFMGSKDFLLLRSPATPPTLAHMHLLHSCSSSSQTLCIHSSSQKNSRLFASPKHFPPSYQRAIGSGFTTYSSMPIPRPINSVNVGTLEKQFVDDQQLKILSQKLQKIGIDGTKCMPGQHSGLICPSCKGWNLHEKSLSLHIKEDGSAAVWTCFQAKCGWQGSTRASADAKSTYLTMSTNTKVRQPTRVITKESLGLEPLCNELLAYFAERMISQETLWRNVVMQKRTRDKIAIAFTYRRNGELVSCKYRDIAKNFWQEVNTEKIFYGLDDIKEASDIIIVEGEMDKLAMEEAGLKNCVSVPNGAPPKRIRICRQKKSGGTKYQYLKNCKNYTDKASRIILATDADPPGQALAEELARHFGGERCWRVKWPKRSNTESFKDANEVLMYMGPDALREVVESAERVV